MNIMTVFLLLVICALFCAVGYLIKDNDQLRKDYAELGTKYAEQKNKIRLPLPVTKEEEERRKREKRELENFYSYDGTRQRSPDNPDSH